MKKQGSWIIPALALVAVLLIAVLLYRHLSERYVAKSTTQAVTAVSDKTTDRDDSGMAERELASDFTVSDGNSEAVQLSDRFGKPIVLNFWASWCGPCCSELPAFEAAAKAYADKIDFMMVNLTDGRSETVSSVQSFLSENGYTFPVYFDTNQDASDAYGVFSIPKTVFIRADGTVLDSYIGAMREETLQEYIAQLLK